MKYIITFLITVSFSTMAQEPELEGYTSVYANYTFCKLNDGATFDDVRPFVGMYVENANSFENEVDLAVLFPLYASDPDHDFFFVATKKKSWSGSDAYNGNKTARSTSFSNEFAFSTYIPTNGLTSSKVAPSFNLQKV